MSSPWKVKSRARTQFSWPFSLMLDLVSCRVNKSSTYRCILQSSALHRTSTLCEGRTMSLTQSVCRLYALDEIWIVWIHWISPEIKTINFINTKFFEWYKRHMVHISGKFLIFFPLFGSIYRLTPVLSFWFSSAEKGFELW